MLDSVRCFGGHIERGSLDATESIGDSAIGPDAIDGAAPQWTMRSARLTSAYELALDAHGHQPRATDRGPFLAHVVEVGGLLDAAGFDEELVAAGLLHDSVERGTLSERRLRRQMGDEVSDLVIALTEDAEISSFAARKEALRGQVRAAGTRAVTIFAADKLSDIRGLQGGIRTEGRSIEARMGTTVEAMAGHYRDSVSMIESSDPQCTFLAGLHAELLALQALAARRIRPRSAEPGPRARRQQASR